MPPRPLLSCWLLTLACGARPVLELEPGALDLTGQDAELVSGVLAARARVLAAPDDIQAQFELASILDANEFDEPAEAAWQRVIALAPENPGAWYQLARVCERRGATVPALEALQRVLELAPLYAPAHLRAGRLRLDAGRLDEAGPPLRRALELDPESPAALLALARLELLRDQPSRAIELLEPLRQRLPREPYVNGLLARAWASLGDPARATLCLQAEERAGTPSARDPWQAEVQRHALGMKVRLERARALLASGDAVAAWKQLEPLESRAGELVVLDVQCQVLLALGRPDEVLARLARADPRLRENTLLVVNRVLALRDRGAAEDALEEITSELRRNPGPPGSHALRGELLFGLARFAEAIEAFEEARSRGEDSLASALQLARSRTADGDLDGGLRDLEEAARSFPFAPKPWAYRCEVLALAGRATEARASLEEALRRGLEPELVARVEARIEELGAAFDAESSAEPSESNSTAAQDVEPHR